VIRHDALSTLRAGLSSAAEGLHARGIPTPPLGGKLLRPLVALACVPPTERTRPGRKFWSGALAVQMVHEASLLHDDIVDGADRRRGRPTMVAEHGVGAALVAGDRYLTAAYRAAAECGSADFLLLFVEAVERTVAGEAAQARATGRPLEPSEYGAILRDKSGQLFRAACALHACIPGEDRADALAALGIRIGTLYQKVDDLLDYCPSAEPGKPRFQDYRQGKWTWIFEHLGLDRFGRPVAEVDALIADGVGPGGHAELRNAVDVLADEADSVTADHRALVPGDALLGALMDGWIERAHDAVDALSGAAGASADPRGAVRPGAADPERRARTAAPAARTATAVPSALVDDALRRRALEIGAPPEWISYFGEHSRTFRFASRLFPPAPTRDVTGVYAFCRFTDDLADEPDPALDDDGRRARLARWKELARASFEGHRTSIPLLDEVVAVLPERDVPFHYVEELIDGVASDIGGVRIADEAELRRYTYRVASVVGGWVTRLFGVHDREVLVRAYDLGHAMQLTNILRDVGEDARNGRVYLPAATMDTFGVTSAWLERFARGETGATEAWAELVETLMDEADRHYDRALAAVPHLPSWYQRPVVVAARVYQGIHDRIRANGYDSGTRRAYTGPFDKARLGLSALWNLRGLRRAAEDRSLPAAERPPAPLPSHAAAHRSRA